MNKTILISGYGSIGRKHAHILSRLVNKKKITILTNQKLTNFRTIKTLKSLNEINPQYIVICNPTSDHINKIKFIEKNCKNKIVLVEKPLFSRPNKINVNKNKYYVGYNLRFNSIIDFLKKKIKSEKIWNVNIFCGSYLPKWRNNIDYTKSASAKKNLGGGVLLDLSHELDYAQWLFGKIQIEHCKSKKLSNLNIETDDFLTLIGKTKKVPSIQITLNYFTRHPLRTILIDGKNISIQADLIRKNVICHEGNKKKIYNFKNSFKDYEYKNQHLAILKKKNTRKLCSFNEGKELVYLINQIRSKSLKKMNSILCTICMRSGSQGVRGKNSKLINGKPLMYFTIKQAIKTKIFDNIVVSTDSNKILMKAKSYGAEGWFLRPKSLASNKCSKMPVIKHALKEAEKFYSKKFKFIVDLDVTSPLRRAEDIIKAYKLFIKKGGDALITGSRSKKNPYFNVVEIANKKIKKVKNMKKKIYRRQDAPITYDMNASIYIWNRKTLINSNILNKALEPRSKSRTILYEMPENRSIDIDSELDFKIVNFLLKDKNKKNNKK